MCVCECVCVCVCVCVYVGGGGVLLLLFKKKNVEVLVCFWITRFSLQCILLYPKVIVLPLFTFVNDIHLRNAEIIHCVSNTALGKPSCHVANVLSTGGVFTEYWRGFH